MRHVRRVFAFELQPQLVNDLLGGTRRVNIDWHRLRSPGRLDEATAGLVTNPR